MLPTLGEERRATYSPFLPISPKTGRVLYVPIKKVDAEQGTITFDDEDGEDREQAAQHRPAGAGHPATVVGGSAMRQPAGLTPHNSPTCATR